MSKLVAFALAAVVTLAGASARAGQCASWSATGHWVIDGTPPSYAAPIPYQLNELKIEEECVDVPVVVCNDNAGAHICHVEYQSQPQFYMTVGVVTHDLFGNKIVTWEGRSLLSTDGDWHSIDTNIEGHRTNVGFAYAGDHLEVSFTVWTGDNVVLHPADFVRPLIIIPHLPL